MINVANKVENSGARVITEEHKDQEPRITITIGSLTLGAGFENGNPKGVSKGNIVINCNHDNDLIEVNKAQLISQMERFLALVKKAEL